METTATLRGVRLSAQKGRLVADQIRGLPVDQALNILTFSPKKGARIIKKVLESAIANAEHNDGADIDELKVKTIYVDKADVLKRFSARAKGRGNASSSRPATSTSSSATETKETDHGTENSSDRFPPCGHAELGFEVVREQQELRRHAERRHRGARLSEEEAGARVGRPKIMIERPAKNARITDSSARVPASSSARRARTSRRCAPTCSKMMGGDVVHSTSRKSASRKSTRN